jgi:predicted Zn-dependent protease
MMRHVRKPGDVLRSAGIGLVLLAQMFQGCAMNPVTGRLEVTFVSAKQERELGREAAQEVAETMGLTDDPERIVYIRAIGERLARESPRQDVAYTFQIVEMQEPNAFALPGGYVFVSRGLLPLANSEDELAGVIGHEIGHVAARHAVRRITVSAPFAVVSGITGFAVGLLSSRLGHAVAGITQFAGSFVIAPYSREQEREADSVGVEMAARAGWDPAALSRFLATLEREVEVQSGKPHRTGFFDTHPGTPERVVKIAEQAKETERRPGNPIAGTRAEFLAKLDGLIIGNDPAVGVFQDARFLQPSLNFTVAFPDGWKTQNTPLAVLAAAVEGRAFVLLGVAGEGDDPGAPARALEEKLQAQEMPIEHIMIGGLRAARALVEAHTDQGPAALDLTWIAHQGRVYQITGVTRRSDYLKFQSAFAGVAQSFRPLQVKEREAVQVVRLRIVSAHDGESPEQIASRTGSEWDAKALAVANGLETTARLHNGQLIKVAIREPYKPPLPR